MWSWVSRYWRTEWPEAEIVVGTSDCVPFSKSQAINDAASKASGDVFVLMDADCYMSPQNLQESANALRASDEDFWVTPYSHFYRLSEDLPKHSYPPNPPVSPDSFTLPTISWTPTLIIMLLLRGGMVRSFK